MRALLLLVALLPAVAHAQDAPPPPSPDAPAPPPVEAPPPPPAPQPSPADACRARRHELEDQAAHTSDLQQRARILQSLPDCAHPGDAPPPPLATDAATMAPTPAVEAATGFAIELRLDTSLTQVGNNTFLSLPGAGLFLGYRAAGATFGLGFDFQRSTQSRSSTGSPDSDQSVTSFLVMPGVRIPIVHSGDGRTELLASIDAGYGTLSTSDSANMGMDPPAVGHLRLQAAPAVRFWVSHSFGVGAAVGLRYDHLSQDSSSMGFTSSQTLSTLALFSSFHVVGVF